MNPRLPFFSLAIPLLARMLHLVRGSALFVVLLFVAACSSDPPDTNPPSNQGELRISPETTTLAVGATARVVAELVAADGTATTLSEVEWSSDGTAAKVEPQDDGSVMVTGVRKGTTNLTAKAAAGSATATVQVTSADGGASVELVSIEVAPAALSVPVGVTRAFTATGVYSDNHTEDLTAEAAWTSSSPAFASVGDAGGNKGKVTTLTVGKTTIAATVGEVRGATTLTVTAATLVSIAVTPTDPSIAKGTTQQLTATGTYSDETTQDLSATVTWGTAAENVATVDQTGLATGVTTGTALLSATSGTVSGSTTLTVTAATLVSIEVTPVNPSIAKGLTQQFTATGVYSDTTVQDLTATVTWSSSAPAFATVSNAAGSHGLATGVADGATVVSAVSGAVTGSTTLTVTAATLVSIEVTPANPSIAKGLTQQFTATGVYSDTTVQDLTATVTWSSSAPAFAMVSNAAGSRGLATGVAEGATVVSAVSGAVSGSTTLTVTGTVLVSIAVTPANVTLTAGTTQQLTATGTYSDATTIDLTATVTWSSSAMAFAAVSNAAGSRGLVTGVAAGPTTIRATSGDVSGATTVTVTEAVLVSIAVTPSNPSIAAGTTQQLTATGTYSDATTQDLTATVTWSSSAPAFATVSNAAGSQGLATALGIGNTTLSATSGAISGTTTLTVTPAVLVSIAVTPSNPTLGVGTTQQLTATGTYSDGTTLDLSATVTWVSSAPAAATVSNAAGSRGLASAIAAGETTLSATSGAVSGTTTLTVSACHVTVNEVSVAGAGGAGDEFVELYNGCAFPIDLKGWKLVYRSATGASEQSMFSFAASTVLAPGGFRLYVGPSYMGPPGDGAMGGGGSGSFAAPGGGLGLRDGSNILRDSMGYGTATNIFVEGTVAPAPPSGSSVCRYPADGTDTNDNIADFHVVGRTPRAPNL